MKRNIIDVIEKMCIIAENHYSGVAFRTDDTSDCIFCHIDPDTDEHEMWCAWTIGRTFSASDITAVKRLIRVSRYSEG